MITDYSDDHIFLLLKSNSYHAAYTQWFIIISIPLIFGTTVRYSHLAPTYSRCVLNENMSQEAFVQKTNRKNDRWILFTEETNTSDLIFGDWITWL